MKKGKERELEILRFVKQYSDKHGYSPSFEEIAVSVGLKSRASVHGYMHQLEERGLIELPNATRSIVITKEGEERLGNTDLVTIDTLQLMDLSQIEEVIQVDDTTGEITLSKDAMLFISQVDLLERWSTEGKKRMQSILKDKMEEYEVTSLKSDDITVSYKGESERTSLNQKILKEKYPEAYFSSLEEKPVKASVSIRRKKA